MGKKSLIGKTKIESCLCMFGFGYMLCVSATMMKQNRFQDSVLVRFF